MVDDVLVGSRHEEGDQDSLFGSPPPSPRGRSPSPTLALPSYGNGLNDRQNVGTIALPGSHPYSELPMNPLALSLSLPHASRPPAQAPQQQPPQQRTASASTSNSGRSSSITQQKKKKAQPKSKESTPRPAGPEFQLPDPSAPPPANFLRSQSALLGTAGLVGGIKPSQLSTNRYSRGTTPSNPIIVDDEEEAPAIGRSCFRSGMVQTIDATKLPAPSNQDIVAMLIGQKDIFPVLESILKLIASGAQTQPRRTGFERKLFAEQQQPNANASGSNSGSSDRPPPLKRRKLNRVPAGAADWDVPYPFAQGEGPEEYRANWERERGRRLIAQLVNLIKIAARKAAMKNYLQHEENRKKYEDERRKIREAEERRKREARAKANFSTSDVLLDKSNELSVTIAGGGSAKNTSAWAPRASTSPVESAVTSGTATPYSCFTPSTQRGGYSQLPNLPTGQQNQTESSPAFDQLISSLLSASPAHNVSFGNAPSSNMQSSMTGGNPAFTGGIPASEDNSGSISPVDQALFDSWMSVLQAFPVPSGGFQQTQGQSSVASSSTSTPAPDNDGFDFTGLDFQMDGDRPSVQDFDATLAGSSHPLTANQFPATINTTEGTHLAPQNLSDIDHSIDPILLAISVPQPVQHDDLLSIFNEGLNTNKANVIQPPSLVPSPILSTGSTAGHNCPPTPNSAAWEVSLPDIFMATDDQDNAGTSNSTVDTTLGGLGGIKEVLASAGESSSKAASTKGKEKEIARIEDSTLSSPLSSPEPTASDSTTTTLVDLTTKTLVTESGNSKATPGQPISPAIYSFIHSSEPSPSASLAPSTFASSFSTPASSSSVPIPVGIKTSAKQDILRRAKERRQQLAAKLVRVKTQLWETTIEQGVLAHVVRHYNEVASSKES